jgi:hypothetical protein
MGPFQNTEIYPERRTSPNTTTKSAAFRRNTNRRSRAGPSASDPIPWPASISSKEDRSRSSARPLGDQTVCRRIENSQAAFRQKRKQNPQLGGRQTTAGSGAARTGMKCYGELFFFGVQYVNDSSAN